MKLRKLSTILFSLGIIVSVSTESFAQSKEQPSTKDIAKKRSEMMKECLDLSKKQYKEIYKINLDYIEARKAQKATRPSLPKEGKHFKGAVCPPSPEAPHNNGCERPKPDCMNVSPDGKPMMKPDCNRPCPQMKAVCPKQKPCPDMKGCPTKPGDCPDMKGGCSKIKPMPPKGGKCPMDSLSRVYDSKIKEVLTASQYDKWIGMKLKCKPGHKGTKPMPCPKK